jgi:hypothetical protein
MTSILISEILLYIFVLVDDWYLEHAGFYRQGQPGRKPEFRDSEVMTIMLAPFQQSRTLPFCRKI